jgi:2-phosphinomethylmalic acid synthase
VLLIKDLNIIETGLLSSTSDFHTYHKFTSGDRAKAAAMYLEAVEIALDHGIRPRVHYEDTTRSDPGYVEWLTEQVLSLAQRYPATLAPRFRICDTLGVSFERRSRVFRLELALAAFLDAEAAGNRVEPSRN